MLMFSLIGFFTSVMNCRLKNRRQPFSEAFIPHPKYKSLWIEIVVVHHIQDIDISLINLEFVDENAGICSRSLLWNASSILQVSASSYWGASWCFLYLFCDLKHVHLLLINLFESSITLMLHIFNIFVELVHSTFVDNLLSQLVIQIWNSFLSAEWRSGQDGGGEDFGRDRDGRNEGCFSVCNVHFSLPTSHTRCCWLNAHMSAIYHCCIVVGISLFHQFPSGILSSVAWWSCVINVDLHDE